MPPHLIIKGQLHRPRYVPNSVIKCTLTAICTDRPLDGGSGAWNQQQYEMMQQQQQQQGGGGSGGGGGGIAPHDLTLIEEEVEGTAFHLSETPVLELTTLCGHVGGSCVVDTSRIVYPSVGGSSRSKGGAGDRGGHPIGPGHFGSNSSSSSSTKLITSSGVEVEMHNNALYSPAALGAKDEPHEIFLTPITEMLSCVPLRLNERVQASMTCVLPPSLPPSYRGQCARYSYAVHVVCVWRPSTGGGKTKTPTTTTLRVPLKVTSAVASITQLRPPYIPDRFNFNVRSMQLPLYPPSPAFAPPLSSALLCNQSNQTTTNLVAAQHQRSISGGNYYAATNCLPPNSHNGSNNNSGSRSGGNGGGAPSHHPGGGFPSTGPSATAAAPGSAPPTPFSPPGSASTSSSYYLPPSSLQYSHLPGGGKTAAARGGVGAMEGDDPVADTVRQMQAELSNPVDYLIRFHQEPVASLVILSSAVSIGDSLRGVITQVRNPNYTCVKVTCSIESFESAPKHIFQKGSYFPKECVGGDGEYVVTSSTVLDEHEWFTVNAFQLPFAVSFTPGKYTQTLKTQIVRLEWKMRFRFWYASTAAVENGGSTCRQHQYGSHPDATGSSSGGGGGSAAGVVQHHQRDHDGSLQLCDDGNYQELEVPLIIFPPEAVSIPRMGAPVYAS